MRSLTIIIYLGWLNLIMCWSVLETCCPQSKSSLRASGVRGSPPLQGCKATGRRLSEVAEVLQFGGGQGGLVSRRAPIGGQEEGGSSSRRMGWEEAWLIPSSLLVFSLYEAAGPWLQFLLQLLAAKLLWFYSFACLRDTTHRNRQHGCEHNGRHQKEDAGDETGEGGCCRQSRPAWAVTFRAEGTQRQGQSVLPPLRKVLIQHSSLCYPF